MAKLRIESTGFIAGRWRFPAFSLRDGEALTLRFPKGAFFDQDCVVAALTGSKPAPGLTVCGSVVFADFARNSTGWRQWLFPSTPFDWLKGHTALTEDAIAAFLRDHEMDRRTPLNRYALNPRMFMGLMSAYARKPDVVVFSTGGLDPWGVGKTFRIVSDRLAECPAVYLSWPFVCRGQEQWNEFPGSSIVSVLENEDLPGSRTSELSDPRMESGITPMRS